MYDRKKYKLLCIDKTYVSKVLLLENGIKQESEISNHTDF